MNEKSRDYDYDIQEHFCGHFVAADQLHDGNHKTA
jgi:hypothetical protein